MSTYGVGERGNKIVSSSEEGGGRGGGGGRWEELIKAYIMEVLGGRGRLLRRHSLCFPLAAEHGGG